MSDRPEPGDSEHSTADVPPKPLSLLSVSGRLQGAEFHLDPGQPLIVGRDSEHDIVLDEAMVSRAHARLTLLGDQVFVEDLGSSNGIFVNGRKAERGWLKSGDRLLIGCAAERIPEINKMLVEHGIPVLEITHQRLSLEQLYFTLTGPGRQ